jgi:hypothetical protein
MPSKLVPLLPSHSLAQFLKYLLGAHVYLVGNLIPIVAHPKDLDHIFTNWLANADLLQIEFGGAKASYSH